MSAQQEAKAITIHLRPSRVTTETSYSDTGFTGAHLRRVFPTLELAVKLLIIARQQAAVF